VSLLLDKIERLGSLRAAAREANMSYRYAFKRIDLMNERLGVTVKMRRGGVDNGGAELTPFGKKLLRNYQSIQIHVDKVASNYQQLEELAP
jgi:molybdate transport system regulatory protein|tara:strand:- start:416 stop:688 length:273 start_codon:yes stop_codon:yes gene_type:complete